MKYIAPSDVTAPPNGWTWALRNVHSWRPGTGEMRYIVTQEVNGEMRVSRPMSSGRSLKLMAKWNEEAKQA